MQLRGGFAPGIEDENDAIPQVVAGRAANSHALRYMFEMVVAQSGARADRSCSTALLLFRCTPGRVVQQPPTKH